MNPITTLLLHDREQRALIQQVERLQQSLAAVQGEHEQQLASAQAAHLQQLQDNRAELEARQQQWVCCTCLFLQSAHAPRAATVCCCEGRMHVHDLIAMHGSTTAARPAGQSP